MSHDIFISYSRHDIELMQQVRDTLRDSEFKVWTDEGIEPGSESWKVSISEAITECTSVVVLFSPDSAKSTWVNRELDFAELHKKKIYPLLVRGEVEDALPFGYTTFQFVDIRAEDTRFGNLQRLIATLQGDFPNRQFSASVHPQVLDPINAKPEEAYHEPIEPAYKIEEKEEVSWKPVETPHLRMFVPSTWKISEPTHENWARTTLLMLDDEAAMYQFLQDERQMVSLLTGLPGGRIERYKLFTDISGLEPLAGFMVFAYLPFTSSNFPILTDFFTNRYLKRLDKYQKQYLQSEIINSYWLSYSHGRILAYESQSVGSQNGKSRSYAFVPFLGRSTFTISLVCGHSRFEREKEIYDRMAQSLQFVRG